jgi:hypothetical protein
MNGKGRFLLLKGAGRLSVFINVDGQMINFRLHPAEVCQEFQIHMRCSFSSFLFCTDLFR